MRTLFLCLALGLCLPACKDQSVAYEGTHPTMGDPSNGDDNPEPAVCDHLYGRPTENTGLTEEQCNPTCNCGGLAWEEPTYTEDDLKKLDARVLLTDPDEFYKLDDNPYDHPEDYLNQHPKTAVCGVLDDDSVAGGYRLKTYESDAAALADGAVITHYTACGLCSSMQDLAVYIRARDLTNPVRSCAMIGVKESDPEVAYQKQHECLTDLGFSDACAHIWYYNVRHTQKECLSSCLLLLEDPHHLPDGSLNDCIQCDEDISGPIFQAISGRTRRNSGLASGLCRPCDTVAPVDHHGVMK